MEKLGFQGLNCKNSDGIEVEVFVDCYSNRYWCKNQQAHLCGLIIITISIITDLWNHVLVYPDLAQQTPMDENWQKP